MPAFYRNDVHSFLCNTPAEIIGRLTTQSAEAGFYSQQHSQTESWAEEIDVLKGTFNGLALLRDLSSWHILLEYPIPRRGKRIDAILLAEGVVFVLEFKCGRTVYSQDSILQVEDYCLDLRDFHEPSGNLLLIPVVVSTQAEPPDAEEIRILDGVASTLKANSSTLTEVIDGAVTQFRSERQIDSTLWDSGAYEPTPTIIEAARHLYAGQNVKEISRCHGGIENLTHTSEAVSRAVEKARQDNRKIICFITGVPGAGKTLAGLNIIHNAELHLENLGVFLSGNGPLIAVLTEALARDHRRANNCSLDVARRKVSTFIHNVHRFIDTYYGESNQIPPDKIVVFDEAQRAWNQKQSIRKFNRPFSEPELMLEIMDRHQDWAVIVALIGGGQEINSGEAGLAEWGRTLMLKFPHWRVLVSPKLLTQSIDGHDALFSSYPADLEIQTDPLLHLNVSIRAYKAESLSKWVEALLDRNLDLANEVLPESSEYPIVMTRNLDVARSWLKVRQRGTRRTGIIASSGARRLRALGLDVYNRVEVVDWFLNPPVDVRSSYSLETVATEFDIQGLELDWTCVAWGGDLVPKSGGWLFRQFKGTKWQKVNDDVRKKYILNKYRVLLTRAREGMIIFVPQGSLDDQTRPPEYYDRISEYLLNCGVKEL